MTTRPGSIGKGLLVGIMVPAVGMLLLEGIVKFLGTTMDVNPAIKTIALLAICLNMIPLNIFRKERGAQTIRGIVLATLIYAAFWIFAFHKELIGG